jgi:hypothetical protein
MASEKTAGQKAMDAARKAVADAKTDAQKTAAAEKVTAAKGLLRQESAATFKRLATARVSKAIAAIRNIGKLANARAYAFDKDQCSKIETALKTETDAALKRFAAALAAPGTTTETGFTL